MSTIFNDLSTGLQQAIDFEKGCGDAIEYTYSISPLQNYSGKQIRAIRMKNKMTQVVFAMYMGVSTKTVEAWERGTTTPSGSARRLLSILETNEYHELPFFKKSNSV